jgi:hypothetical protein
MMGVKMREVAAGAFSFVNCEVNQSGELSLLPLVKGSKERSEVNRYAELPL